MKLLILTQTVDTQNPVLGFFHRWIEEFAKHAELVTVICLKEGEHNLPQNVKVLSLGKEKGASRLKYIWNFYRHIFQERKNYDSVFVHMNQEYILLGGVFWKILGKKIYMWRNHYDGSFLTNIAAIFCRKIFCTSKHSYTAKFQKTQLMPVGVDTEQFYPDTKVERVERSVLFLSRIAPSKRVEWLIEALKNLHKEGITFTATIVGSPLPEDEIYHTKLQSSVDALGLSEQICFRDAVPHELTPDIYGAHEIFVNTSRSGMFDKTLFEASACGCRVIASSKDFADLAGQESYFGSVDGLTNRLREHLKVPQRSTVPPFVAKHSLTTLVNSLVAALK